MTKPKRIAGPPGESVHSILELTEDETYWLPLIFRVAWLGAKERHDEIQDPGMKMTAEHIMEVIAGLQNRVKVE